MRAAFRMCDMNVLVKTPSKVRNMKIAANEFRRFAMKFAINLRLRLAGPKRIIESSAEQVRKFSSMYMVHIRLC